jgi:hypothetical protein
LKISTGAASSSAARRGFFTFFCNRLESRGTHQLSEGANTNTGERIMLKWTTAVLAGLACCLTLTALNAGTDMGCLPPPLTQDYVKKTVRVEIKGKLEHVRIWLEGPRDPKFPTPDIAFLDYWQITVGGKTYRLEFPEQKYLTDLADKLAGKTAIVTGTLNGDTVQVAGLKADEDSVKQTTEVEVRGRLQAVLLRCGPGSKAWNVIVDGKTYFLDIADPRLRPTAETLDGKDVLITGVMNDDTITVKTLKAAQ